MRLEHQYLGLAGGIDIVDGFEWDRRDACYLMYNTGELRQKEKGQVRW
jgi:hypothetical protein